jgi:dsRNA-specific ribonuclease
MTSQNYIDLLEEYCLQNNISSIYNFPEQKSFSCFVTVNNIKGIGFGDTKEEARENASKDAYESLDIKKNFVGSLNEYCITNNLDQPIYSVVNMEGESHRPTFNLKGQMFSPSGKEVVVFSSGKTKKIAKQLAAEKILNLLINSENSEFDSNSTDQIKEKPKKKNFIGLLNEICTKKTLLPPVYNVVSVDGKPHQPLFKFQCSLTLENEEKISVLSDGNTKKEAKQSAAEKILDILIEKCET